jgi:hypothetical protein
VQHLIAHLKSGQADLARDRAQTAEQLKPNPEQKARAIATASEQNLRPRTSVTTSAATSANPPLPVANPARKPASTLPPPPQARAQARAPVQLQPRQQ